jgi:aminoglycoside phosphotransferase family enzyme
MSTSRSFQDVERVHAVVDVLRDPAAYPERPRAVTVRETHMAWVFLTDRYAYKLKKPVTFSFLDYSTPARRRAACRAELALNSRLAPWVYLGMTPVLIDGDGHLRLEGAEGAPAAWLVKMRRLPDDGFLESAIRDGTVTTAWLDEAAQLLARFFAAQTAEPLAPQDYVARMRATVAEDAAAVQASATGDQGARAGTLARRLDAAIAARAGMLGERAARRVNGHGDLRPEHVALGPPAAVIDCIEFSRAFRMNDPVEELAFLHLECSRLGAGWVVDPFRAAYRDATGDAPPGEVMPIYAAKRSLLRAKLALWHIGDDGADADHWRGRAATYLALGEAFVSALD